MDERVTGELPDEDEYAALHDPPQVMAEVLRLLDELRRTGKKLGDALEVAGLPGREWRAADARLSLLSEQFPDISVDDLITRLAEFAAGHAPLWLRGDAGTLMRFREEVEILYGVLRSLRQAAQRQRMLPARDRGGLPLERALGDARVGTALDLAARDLRDLDSLSPFIAPLAPEEWQALDAARPPDTPAATVSGATVQASPHASPTSGAVGTASLVPGAAAVPASPSPPTLAPAPSHTRLRDFAPPREAGGMAAGRAGVAGAGVAAALRRALRPNKWWVVGLAALTLATGTVLLSLAERPPAGHLVASPARFTLTCAGKEATAALTLRATGTGPIVWSAKPPAGIGLSTTRGTLKPGASTTIQVAVRTAKTAHGTLTFTSNDGTATVAYVVTCA